MKEREICTIPNDNTYWEFLHHYARNTMVTNGNLEFDGEKCIVLERQISIDNQSMVFLQNTTFSKIAMKDYQESQFQVLEYKIQDISANSESPNIIFAGFRYSDSANVVGTITEKMKLLSIMLQKTKIKTSILFR